ncbi:transcription factor Opi1-domain-containing protein [Gilbertella persicaria]|uniref:transcription factor Opi1-domain-containing protein n=1 Tax=Gilbertella persicaria TaxID=101096 RepID=UPI00221F3B3F|nr:transcription factor Opi1-domain-containing protein [Gilbertella persicaria]KAI8063710.1 transcription factor Opi1-domain-containing protein [Gilbertella persicaria]
MNYTITATTTNKRSDTNTVKLSESYTPSTWQQIVVGAGSAAGSTAAVVSEESMKCLKYCSNWLHYAIQQLAHQMSLARDFLVSLATRQKQEQPMLLSSIKKNMVTTLRKVIDIITCYAGNALPYQAKASIRGAILSLPNRWASMYDGETNNDVIQQQTKHDTYKQEDVALRLLAFGKESTDMLRSIQSVFEDTIQRAEGWLERLRMMNPISPSINNNVQLPSLTPKHFEDLNNSCTMQDEKDDFCNVLLPPIRNLHISRTSSSTS